MSDDTVDWFGFRVYPWNVPERRPGCYLFTNVVKPDKHYVGVCQSVFDRCKGHSPKSSPPKFRSKRRATAWGRMVLSMVSR